MKPVRMSVVRWRRARVDLKSHPLQFGGKMKMCLSSAPHDSVVFSSSLARASRSAHLLIFLRNWFPVSSNKCGKDVIWRQVILSAILHPRNWKMELWQKMPTFHVAIARHKVITFPLHSTTCIIMNFIYSKHIMIIEAHQN